MERLTTRHEADAAYYYLECFEKCDGLGASEKCNNCDLVHDACEKLGEYEDLEEQDLLLKLPCKVGDTVWFVGNKFVNDYEIRRFIVGEIGIDAIQVAKTIRGTDYWNSFSIDDIGKTVFLTQAEAKQKLKEMKP